MKEPYFDIAKKELKEGVKNPQHPFHYFTLATTGINRVPRLRTVVLRDFSKDMIFTLYTDKRSRKVTHIKENNRVCLLFYNPETWLQIKIDGVAYMETDMTLLDALWNKMDETSRQDYLTLQDPGERISHLEQIEYLNTSKNFSVMHIEAYKLEYLQLDRPNHIRVQFHLNEQGTWDSTFLIP